ncbi:MAG: GDYXXLXY domain-containing protein [Gammaproteobacteria bacterium]
MKHLRTILLIAGLVLVLAATNFNIAGKARVIQYGRPVLLELRPADPRSLIQGDYMQLRYASRAFPSRETAMTWPHRGIVVLRLDDHRVGTYARQDDGLPLADDEVRLRYRSMTSWGELRYGAEAFYFQEGKAEVYQEARYGVLRVDPSGTSVLAGLADDDHLLIQPE